MVRTQIQLTEEQASALKALAAARRVSLAELVRQSIEGFLAAQQALDRSERKRRALAVVGKFRSDVTDLSVRHDDYLAEAYGE